MIKYFKTDKNGKAVEIQECERNCRIYIERPDAGELNDVSQKTGVPPYFLQCALDEEESPRLEHEDDVRMTLVDAPIIEENGKISTIPMAIIYNAAYFITVCPRRINAAADFLNGKGHCTDTARHKKSLYALLNAVVKSFLLYLKQIDKADNAIQQRIGKRSVENKEIIELLELQKSLVFFAASLSSDQSIAQKLLLGNGGDTEDEKELLDELIIELRQAVEMCTIYREVLKNVTDAVSSVVNNNMNFIMKFLTAITIILSVPMVIAGFWGMNTAVPWEGKLYGFWIAVGISVVLSAAALVWLWRRRML
ncbi:magnesium transporter [Clostridia bacterium]|nr:magnesium transporter [Clostridia bacterium]